MKHEQFLRTLFIFLCIQLLILTNADAQITAMRDNTLYESGNGTLSNGSGQHFFAGRTGAELQGAIRRGLIAFDIAGQIPANATITGVVLRLHMSRTSSIAQPVSLHRLLADWGEGASDAGGQEGGGTAAVNPDATWIHTFYNDFFWTNAGGDFDANASATQTVGAIGFYTWGSSPQMVDDVQTWLDTPQQNFGWLVMGNEASEQTAKRFDSRENPNADNRPVLQINYTLPNNAPVASNDSASTNEDNSVIVNVLLNDSDSDGTLNPASVTVVDAPGEGTITNINVTTGAITYTPDSNFNGSDSFTYTVDDDDGATSNTATVSISVLAVNDLPFAANDTAQTNEDAFVLIDVLNNDSDIDGSLVASTVTIINDPVNGTITGINPANGVITYNPNENFNGSDIFTYTVDDDSGAASNRALVTVTVLSRNDPPVAENDSAQTNEDAVVLIDILNNDSDIDGTLVPSTVTVTAGPSNGAITAVNPANGSITYDPNENFNGSDSFTYTVEDDSGAISNVAIVTVSVQAQNDGPVLSAIPPVFFNEDESLTIPLGEWQDYVDDPDDPDSALFFTGLPGDYVTIQLDSFFVSFHAPDDWFGSDTLILIVSDGFLADSAQILITVLPINDAPEFSNLPDSVTFDNSGNYIFELDNLIEDRDLPGDSLRWEFLVSNDSLLRFFDADLHRLTLTAPGFSGSVFLTITVTDDSLARVTDSVRVDVTETISGINDQISGLPQVFSLYQNYPNPFNPVTQIRFALPQREHVIVHIFNILGQQITTLVDQQLNAGVHQIDFNATNLPSGIYFYALQAGAFSQIRKMILLK